jgi:hypothetical protein
MKYYIWSRNKLQRIKRGKANWIEHILRRNCIR